MSSIHIRDIDEKTLLSLKRLAKRHHRSLQGELHCILEKASALDFEDDINEDLDLIIVNSGLKTRWRRDDLYEDDGR